MSGQTALRRIPALLLGATLPLALAAGRGVADSPGEAAADSAALGKVMAEARRTLSAARRPGPLRAGEDLTFHVRFGMIHAGEAHLQIVGVEKVGQASCYRLRSLARSSGVFGRIYGIDDRVESLMDSSGLMSHRIEKHLREGSYRQEQTVHFDYAGMHARYANGDTLSIPGPVQDDLSAFYVARCLDLHENQVYYLETHSNKVNYPMQVRVYGKEKLRTDAGEFECFKVEPRVDRGGIFKHRGGMLIWMTTDARHLPVRLKSKLPVGSIIADLASVRTGGTAP